MSFISTLHHHLDEYHLLKHDFYKAWSAGTLSKSVLKTYAEQYYHHVAAFPRYLSAIHSLCSNLKDRQILLGNLVDEEQGEENHPELWTRFAESMGNLREDIEQSTPLPFTQALVEGYFKLTRSSYAQGMGALYAYERQTPAVSQSKSEGLKKFYGMTDERGLKFFTVHQTTDEWHTAECRGLIAHFSNAEKQECLKGAIDGSQYLWSFLDGMSTLTTQ